MTACSMPKRRRKTQRVACCEWQANIRANGWLETSPSYRALFVHIEETNPHPCEQEP